MVMQIKLIVVVVVAYATAAMLVDLTTTGIGNKFFFLHKLFAKSFIVWSGNAAALLHCRKTKRKVKIRRF